MSAREKFEAAINKIKNLYQQKDELYFQINEAEKERDNIFKELIIEEKILSQSEWELQIDSQESFLQAKTTADQWQDLAEYTETSYHCSFNLLEDDGRLYFDDRRVTLEIKNHEHLQQLVDKYHLKVVIGKNVEKSLRICQNQINSINEWKKILGKTK